MWSIYEKVIGSIFCFLRVCSASGERRDFLVSLVNTAACDILLLICKTSSRLPIGGILVTVMGLRTEMVRIEELKLKPSRHLD